jgi:hypothetical protein
LPETLFCIVCSLYSLFLDQDPNFFEPIILTKILSNTTGYTTKLTKDMQMEKNKVFEEHAFEQLLVFSYLENANQSKYGSGLNTQQSLGNNQYPKSIGDANNVLSNHHFDLIKQGSRFFSKNAIKNSKNKPEQEKITYLLLNWTESVTAVERQGTNHHNADSRTSQNWTGQST